MDSILCDMDQFSDEIWDDAMNLSEQLEEELEKARNKVEQVNVIETPSIIGNYYLHQGLTMLGRSNE